MLLSRNYPPSAALAPYVRRHYVFVAELPPQFELTDSLLSEHAFIRVLVRGDWATRAADGTWHSFVSPVFSGSQSKPMPVRVRGGFVVVGCSLRPSGWAALWDESADAFADRMVSLVDHWGPAAAEAHAAMIAAADDEAMIAVLERWLTAHIVSVGRSRPDPLVRRFEDWLETHEPLRVADAAEALGLSIRQFERQCKHSFGHSPKTVLRRARFLDNAAALRGFASPELEERLAARYADQSHRNREFKQFIGLTPKQFERTPTPLLTAGLKLRAEGLN